MITLRQDIFTEDALKIADWLEDHEIVAYLNEEDQISDQIRQMVNSSNLPIYNQIFNRRGLFYLICLHGESIGYVKFVPKKSGHEIVITIGDKGLWGQGYGKTALKKALSEAFFSLRYEKIDAKIKTMNKRSLFMFEHIGFETNTNSTDMHHLSMDMDTFLKIAA
ncbi:GNAT family N-acetyltransferase [Proteiniclasticum sp. C24MP]|uniref:GNAT family N-acetyltransferase n=1 Tax=Proteiniclasticum sp. C24MP TaxID=3374101 RepID=UPI003754EEAA